MYIFISCKYHLLFTGATVDAFTDNDDILQAIAFQTMEMRNTFSAYPELLLIDATHKLNDLRMPLYVLMNVDDNGESEIIALWLVATEEMKMPGVDILICVFHVMRSFRREVATDKLGISVGERDISLEFLSKIAHACSEDEYLEFYAEFTRSVLRSVVQYFDKN